MLGEAESIREEVDGISFNRLRDELWWRGREWLEARDEVLSVNYAGLPSSPWYERGQKYAPKGTGAVLAFEIAGGVAASARVLARPELG